MRPTAAKNGRLRLRVAQATPGLVAMGTPLLLSSRSNYYSPVICRETGRCATSARGPHTPPTAHQRLQAAPVDQ